MYKRVLVFSDLHLAAPGPLNNFHSGAELAACLRSTCDRDTLLVLNGDIFDFLQVDREPRRLVLSEAPRLIEEMLSQLASSSWGQEVLSALGEHVRAGGSCILLPGNHDPELAHPAAAPALSKALELSARDAERFQLYTDLQPLSLSLGRWQVVIGHGHRSDGFNNIDVSHVRAAALATEAALEFPPGSSLVLETLNALKREHDPATGAPRYAFVDLLKPELPLMLLLPLWVAPRLTAAHLPVSVRHGVRGFIRRVLHRLEDGHYLGDTPPEQPPRHWGEELADQFVSVLTPAERQGDLALMRIRLENWFEGRESAGPGMLSGGPIDRLFGHLIYLMTRDFFDPCQLGGIDSRIVQTLLPEGSGPRIVISGHTHAARCHALPGERLYLNTGTWTDLMQFPTSQEDVDLARWRELFLHNKVARLQRLTYAEVTSDGGALRWWRPEPSHSSGMCQRCRDHLMLTGSLP